MSGLPTVSSLTPYIGAAATIAGVLIGFCLSRIPAYFDRRRKTTGYLRGIESEIEYAAKHARIYVEGDPQHGHVYAPAYRLLTRLTVESTPWLASQSILNRKEIEAVLAHVAAAEEFNRCLIEVDERANERRREVAGRGAPDEDIEYQTTAFLARSIVVNRATLKARNICTGDPPQGTAVMAQAAIRAAAARAGVHLADR